MQSKATTVARYLAELPPDRRQALAAIRSVILENLPEGYAEGMAYGMIGYHVPHDVYPAGYHCDPRQPLPFALLASQKNHMTLGLMCLYNEPSFEEWFRQAWSKTGKKLDMGKSCIRFKRLEDVPLAVIGRAVAKVPVKKFVAFYEAALGQRAAGRRATTRKASAKKVTPRRTRAKVASRAR
jgi:hypothetical protein